MGSIAEYDEHTGPDFWCHDGASTSAVDEEDQQLSEGRRNLILKYIWEQMSSFHDSTGKAWPRPSVGRSDVKKGLFQKRYLGLFIHIGLGPFIILLLVMFYEVPVQSRYGIPYIAQTDPNEHLANVEESPPATRTDVDSTVMQQSGLVDDKKEEAAATATAVLEEKIGNPDEWGNAEAEKESQQKITDEEENRAAEKKRTEKYEKKVAEQEAQRKAEEENRAAEKKRTEENEKKFAEQEAQQNAEEENRAAEKKRTEENEKKFAEQEAQRNAEEEKAAAAEKEAKEVDIKAAQLRKTEEQKAMDEGKANEQTEGEETSIEEKEEEERKNRKENEEQKRSAEQLEAQQIASDKTQARLEPGECDLFEGGWEYDLEGPYYTNETCFSRPQYLDCTANGRPDTGYLHWKWKPRNCELPRFSAMAFMETFRGKTISFAGDSLARNQMQSFMCMLAQVEVPSTLYDHDGHTKWRYEHHHVTLLIIWSPYLLEFSPMVPEYKEVEGVLHLDVLDTTFTDLLAESDILVLSVGQWYSKPAVYMRDNQVFGCHFCGSLNFTDINFFEIYRQGLRHALDKVVSELKGTVILSTFAIQHADHGPPWKGGECKREKPLADEEVSQYAGLHDEMHKVAIGEFNRLASDKSKLRDDVHVDFLDVTRLSLLRADGHPGPYRVPNPFVGTDPSDWVETDCLHYCLPGPVDTWNQLLVTVAGKYL